MTITAGDSVTIEYTGRLTDGTVFDTSREPVAEEAGLSDAATEREYAPLTIEVGTGRVIEGLEDALVGLDAGDTPTVAIPPGKAYGERSDDNIREYGRAEFERMVGDETPVEGAYLETGEGGLAEIVGVDDETVRVDFNHELAGETLEFDVEVVAVESAEN